MKRNSYFNEKTENNIQKMKSEKLINEKKLSEDEEVKDNPYNESESSREDYLPVNEDLFTERNSVIKGISLAFVFFSVIIYSLLYMLAPEKVANLIFEGNYNSTLFNNTLCKIGKISNNFYKLDTINIRDDSIIMNISLNCILNIDNNEEKNYLMIKILYLKNTKIINNVLIVNNNISREIGMFEEIYKDFKINDFPFWLFLYNKDKDSNTENKTKNITSDYLINFF